MKRKSATEAKKAEQEVAELERALLEAEKVFAGGARAGLAANCANNCNSSITG